MQMLNDQNLNLVKTETEISGETDTESVYFHSLAIIQADKPFSKYKIARFTRSEIIFYQIDCQA